MKHVVFLGFGAVGRDVARQLAPETESGTLSLTAVVRDPAGHRDLHNWGTSVQTADEQQWGQLIRSADAVVECAGVPAALHLAPAVIAAGTDLVLTSVGALADASARAGLLAGPGQLWVTSGAIGGFDALGAAADARGLNSVSIRTSKLPSTLVQEWMSPTQAERLRGMRTGDDPLTVFQGDPITAVRRFPTNINVAAALAWATRGRAEPGTTSEDQLLATALQRVRVTLEADPGAQLSRHEVWASGSAGRFEFTFESAPSPHNPNTSALTALAVVRTLRSALTATRPPLR